MLPPPFGQGLLEVRLYAGKVLWMNVRPPIVAADFLGAFGQAVDGRIARRNLHSAGANIKAKLPPEQIFQRGRAARCVRPESALPASDQ